MDIFRLMAERKIQEAVDNGELDDLPLRNQRIPDDALGVPEEERMAFRILKNAGVLPEELQLRRQLETLRRALREEPAGSPRRAELLRACNAREAQLEIALERRRRRPAVG